MTRPFFPSETMRTLEASPAAFAADMFARLNDAERAALADYVADAGDCSVADARSWLARTFTARPHPADLNNARFNAMVAQIGQETPAEDIRNALAILDTLDPNSAALDEVAGRLRTALEKLETPSAVNSGPARGTVVAHPGVPASLYMMSR